MSALPASYDAWRTAAPADPDDDPVNRSITAGVDAILRDPSLFACAVAADFRLATAVLGVVREAADRLSWQRNAGCLIASPELLRAAVMFDVRMAEHVQAGGR